MKEFENQWAVLLGGSSGLGLATAKKLAAHGMNICIVHRDRKIQLNSFEKEVQALESFGVSVKTFNEDALKPEVRNKIIAALPKNSIHLLLHSIAKGSLKTMLGPESEILSKQDLDITLHAMAISWYEWSQALLQKGVFAKESRSIAFTSEGSSRVWPGYGSVSAAKSLLEALMRNMAVEFAPKNLTTNCIQAGTAETPSFLMIPKSDELAAMARKRNPFQRLTRPEDVANAVYLLCKPEARWINGTVLKVDGGESLR